MPIVLGQQNASDSSRQSSNPMMLLPEMLFIPMLTSMHLVPISCVCTSSRPRHGCSGQPYYLLSCTSGGETSYAGNAGAGEEGLCWIWLWGTCLWSLCRRNRIRLRIKQNPLPMYRKRECDVSVCFTGWNRVFLRLNQTVSWYEPKCFISVNFLK